jgi:hypothetical protein
VIVNDFNIECLAVLPRKANPPLIVDADTVLSFAIAFQCFEAIVRWNLEIFKTSCLMQIQQLSTRDSLNRSEPWNIPISKQLFGSGVAERTDHGRQAHYATRDMSNGIVIPLELPNPGPLNRATVLDL